MSAVRSRPSPPKFKKLDYSSFFYALFFPNFYDRPLFRLQKLEKDEHFGDCEPVGDGIRELKIDYAKGYRVYFKETDGKIIILLIGGDKSTQQKDIEKSKDIWKKLKK